MRTSALVLAELSLIKRILLTCSRDEIRTWEGNTKESEALFAQILLDTHRVRLVHLSLVDACGTGGANSCAAGAG